MSEAAGGAAGGAGRRNLNVFSPVSVLILDQPLELGIVIDHCAYKNQKMAGSEEMPLQNPHTRTHTPTRAPTPVKKPFLNSFDTFRPTYARHSLSSMMSMISILLPTGSPARAHW